MRNRLLTGLWAILLVPALVISLRANQTQGQGQSAPPPPPPQQTAPPPPPPPTKIVPLPFLVLDGDLKTFVQGIGPNGERQVIFNSSNARAPKKLSEMVMPQPPSNPPTEAKIALGRQLFFDKQLSLDKTVSCATCHDPERAFTDGKALAVGVAGKVGKRNSQTIVNRGFGRLHFWDGRANSIEMQVLMPIADANEMAMPLPDLVTRLAGIESYKTAFQSVFERPVSSEDIGLALGAYVRSIRSSDAPYDKFMEGQADALSAEAQAGLTLFRGKARCATCHREPTFTDEIFYNTGVAVRDDMFVDDGRFGVSNIDRERGAFKVPTLREVARTAPYMHDGSFATLNDVLDFYIQGGRPNRNLIQIIKPLVLTDDEKKSIIAFLESLSGTITK